MGGYFTTNQIFNLTLLILGAALLLRFNTMEIKKIHAKFSKKNEEFNQTDSQNLFDYLKELSDLHAATSLSYFYLILIAILLVNLYTR